MSYRGRDRGPNRGGGRGGGWRHGSGGGGGGAGYRGDSGGVGGSGRYSAAADGGDKSDGPSGHPRNLRGRAIGMWYAQRGRGRNGATSNVRKTELVPRVHLEPQLQERVDKALLRLEDVMQNNIDRYSDRYRNDHHEPRFEFEGSRLGEVKPGTTAAVKKPRRCNPALWETRRKLPVFGARSEILDAINKNQVCVISGETGSGKSTQVPQFILEQFEERLSALSAVEQENKDGFMDGHCDRRSNEQSSGNKKSGCFVVCTQPRRISAISLAERVAEERGESLGERSVGYKIRMESREAPVRPQQPVVLYCSTGIVLQYLQSDPLLSCVSHLIVDEVHERSLHSDLLLAIIKEKVLPFRPDFRLICMSATLDSDTFVRYFGPKCIHLSVSGRLYPVRNFYLEDFVQDLDYEPPAFPSRSFGSQDRDKTDKFNRLIDAGYSGPLASALLEVTSPKANKVDPDLVVAAVKLICQQAYSAANKDDDDDHPSDGAILVFLPGWDTITDVCAGLEKLNTPYLNRRNTLVLPLHSMLPTSEQRRVFPPPPRGVRKIIVSTMIAEASVTIEDVVYVVDCGKTKLTTIEVDKKNQSRFGERWIARANAKQRMGRAGRVRPGQCYKLYTQLDYEDMAEFEQPEMARTRLEDVILYIKQLALGPPEEFLPKCITPPDREAVVNSVHFLEQLGALESNGRGGITVLGRCLCALSVEPRLGKLLLLASLFGDDCLQPALSIAACLDFKDPFFTPMGKSHLVDESRQQFARKSGQGLENSDHVMLATAIQESYRESYGFLERNFLSSQTLKMINVIREQFKRQLLQLGILPSSRTSNDRTAVGQGTLRAVICGGLYPGVGRGNFKAPRELRGAVDKTVPCDDLMLKCLSTETARRAQFHPKSVVARQRYGLPSALFVFYLAQFSDGAGCVMLHEVTAVDPLPLLIFASSGDCVYDAERQTFVVNGWLRLNCEPQLAAFIKRLRAALNYVFESHLKEGLRKSAGQRDLQTQQDFLDALVWALERTRSAEMIIKYAVDDGGDRSDDEDDR